MHGDIYSWRLGEHGRIESGPPRSISIPHPAQYQSFKTVNPAETQRLPGQEHAQGAQECMNTTKCVLNSVHPHNSLSSMRAPISDESKQLCAMPLA